MRYLTPGEFLFQHQEYKQAVKSMGYEPLSLNRQVSTTKDHPTTHTCYDRPTLLRVIDLVGAVAVESFLLPIPARGSVISLTEPHRLL